VLGSVQEVNVSCDELPVEPTFPTRADECQPESDDDDALEWYEDDDSSKPTDEAACQSWTILRTFFAKDFCGNTANVTQTINVQDKQEPWFLEEPEKKVRTTCSDVPPPPVVEAEDNCNGPVNVTFEEERVNTSSCPENEYTLYRTWTAVDGCGNKNTTTQEVEVYDPAAPTVSVEDSEETVECTDVPRPEPVCFEDDCGYVRGSLKEVVTPSGVCNASYTVEYIYTAVDACGNETVKVQKYHVQDTGKPVFDQEVPAPETYECEVGEQPNMTATDNCTEVEVVQTRELVEQHDECTARRTYLDTWFAEDECGNNATVSRYVYVNDTTPPTAWTQNTTCIRPTLHAPFVRIEDVTNPDEVDAMFKASDSCSDVFITVDSCLSNHDDHFSGEENYFSEDGQFTKDCFYNATEDILYIRARFDWSDPAGRFFTVCATGHDVCGNPSEQVCTTVWIPRDDQSDKFTNVTVPDFGECVPSEAECEGLCPCEYDAPPCDEDDAAVDWSLAYDGRTVLETTPLTDVYSTKFSYSLVAGTTPRPNRLCLDINLRDLVLIETSPATGVELGHQSDTYYSGVCFSLTSGATAFEIRVDGYAEESTVHYQLGGAVGNRLGQAEENACSGLREITGPTSTSYDIGAAIEGRVLVDGTVDGDKHGAAVPVAGAVIGILENNVLVGSVMTGHNGAYSFWAHHLRNIEVAILMDGYFRNNMRVGAYFGPRDPMQASASFPLGLPAPVSGTGNNLLVLLNADKVINEQPEYERTDLDGFRGNGRLTPFWRYALANPANADIRPSERSAAIAGAIASSVCYGGEPGLTAALNSPNPEHATAALNIGWNRGVFDPYRDLYVKVFDYATFVLCVDVGSTSAEETTVRAMLARLNSAD
jgi:hypothetical protein